VTAEGKIKFTQTLGVWSTQHINGVRNYENLTCETCHGAAARAWNASADPFQRAAPPKSANQNSTSQTNRYVGTHEEHVYAPNSMSLPMRCTECHYSDTPAADQMAHADGASPITGNFGPLGDRLGRTPASYDTATYTCSGTYCHGDFPGGGGAGPSPAWTNFNTLSCSACHGMPPVAPASTNHRAEHTACGNCHAGYTSSTLPPLPPAVVAQHVDGTVQSTLTCASCHGSFAGRSALTTVGTAVGFLAAAPPTDATVAAASNQVGAHLGHVNPDPNQPEGQIFLPIPCRECHTGAVDTFTMQHPDGNRFVDYAGSTWSNQTGFLSAVTPGDGTDAGTPLTCTSYCHFSSYPAGMKGSITSWQWRPDVTVTCGSCHGRPPADGDHASVPPGAPTTDCFPCHSETVTAAGKIKFTQNGGVWSTQHLNGTRNYENLTCETCHGNAARAPVANVDPLHRAAPPTSANGRSSSQTNRYVGTHDEHVYARNAMALPIRCTECHLADTPPVTQAAMAHAEGASPITGNFGPLADRLGRTPASYNTTTYTCSGTYCHGDFPGGNGAGPSPAWTNFNTLACNSCHGMPPVAPQSANHGPGDTACGGCHIGYTGSAVLTAAIHVDGIVQSESTCIGCHRAQKGSIPRAAVVGGADLAEGDDFIRASRHVSNGTKTEIVRDLDCILCHSEGLALTSTSASPKMDPTLHAGANWMLELRNLDAPSRCFSDPPDPSCYWCPPSTTCVPPGGSVVAGWKWPGARKGVGAQYTPTPADRDNMDSFCMSCHDADGSSAIAVRSDNAALETSANPASAPVARRLTPFNTADNLRNYNEFAASNTHTLLKNWRTANYTRVLNVRDQYNSQNLPQADWASHHNLNQFRKRYDTVNTTAWPAASWTPSRTTVDGGALNETSGLHCSDCHLNESNAHGSRRTWYLLRNTNNADKEGDTAFSGMTTTTSNDVCARCHNPGVYAIGASSAASRTKGHGDTRCDRWTSAGVAGLGWTGSGMGQLQCLACHGGENPGGIHGTNATYLPGTAAPAVKKYRFMGGGGSMRFYSPKAANNVTDADWQLGTGTVGCYTISTADAFGNCVNHKGGYGNTANNINRSRQLRY
jgi:predicted CxxxxCH...CXXCH cytochrome family protein